MSGISEPKKMEAMQYTVVFQIECLHRYFGGGACPAIALSPTADCRGLLERYRMLFRPVAGGGIVYGPKQSPPIWLRSFNESVPFTFTLTSTDPELDAFTEIGAGNIADPANYIYHFDNSHDITAEVFGGSRQLLHILKNSFARAALPVRPRIFNFSVTDSSSNSTLQVIEPLGRQILREIPIPSDASTIPIDLRGLAEASYSLVSGGKELLKFYLSDRPAAQQWGAVSIYAGGLAQSEYLPPNCTSVDSNGNISSKTFTIAFDSRKTVWRYFIIDPAGKRDFADYDLISSGKRTATEGSITSEVKFLRQAETVPVDGRTAWVFESQLPLPLLQSPSSEFSLTLRPAGNGKRGERPIRLPYAQPRSLAKPSALGQALCSEVFVYV